VAAKNFGGLPMAKYAFQMAMMRPLAVCLVATLWCACGDNIKLRADGGADDDSGTADGGQLDFPDDSDQYVAGIASYVRALKLPAIQDDVPICCYDFGAISDNDGVDNNFAKFIAAVEGVATFLDLQSVYDEVLDDGGLIWLFDHRGLNINKTDQFTLALLYGQFEGATTIVEAKAGEGTFEILSRSFRGNTGTPRSFLDGAIYNKAIPSILAGPRDIEVPFLIPGGEITVPLKRGRISGMATAREDGVNYTQGRLSGYIREDDFYGALNTTLMDRCACIASHLPIFEKNGDTWEATCPPDTEVTDNCTTTEQEICVTIAGEVEDGGLCPFWTFFSANQLDIDSNGDETFDAVSFGLELEAVDATIVSGDTQ